MKHILLLIALLAAAAAPAQERKAQNKPYIDLRPLHFGVHIGFNLQDVELPNVGPQTLTLPESGQRDAYVAVDADQWSPGFSVGVLADMRLNNHFALRVVPTMHFGAKRLYFTNFLEQDEAGRATVSTQDMKNTYISVPIDLKFAAERFNNYRPYIVAGINPMLNLTGKDQDYIHLKRYDTMVEVGLGCDFYLPFFKLIPELKFAYGLGDALDRNHIKTLSDTSKLPYALSAREAHTKMVMLTLYFE